MELIVVRNELTAEVLNSHLEVSRSELEFMSHIPARDDEISYYTSIYDEISGIIEGAERTSRQLVITNNECISLIQFFYARRNNVMSVYMRSSNTDKLRSDLGFLSRLAIRMQMDRMHIIFGSFHVVIGGQYNEKSSDTGGDKWSRKEYIISGVEPGA